MMVNKRSAKIAQDDEEWKPAPVPDTSHFEKIRAAALECTACQLYKRGMQTVFSTEKWRGS
jgi:hypothetical protein